MGKKTKDKSTNGTSSDKFLTPLKYIYLGFTGVFSFIKNLIVYICLGSYYTFSAIFKPFVKLFKYLNSINIGSPRKSKDDSVTPVNLSGEESSSLSKNDSINEQLRINQRLEVTKKKNEKKISEAKMKKLQDKRKELLKVFNSGEAEKRFDKPQTFKYTALSPDGKLINDTFMGVSRLDIYTFLEGEGYTVYSLETSEMINFFYSESPLTIKHKLSTKDLIFFITQLATYLKSGITLTEAMRILEKQLNRKRYMHRIMQSIVYHLTIGESFSNALLKQGNAFPQFVINMVKAAEAAGNLEESLEDLGNYYTEINATRKQMLTAISYPAFVAVFSIAIIAVILIKIVPQFVSIYATAGVELNPLTVFVLAISTFMQNYFFVILLVLAIFIFIFSMAYRQLKSFRVAVQTFLMRLPVVSNIIIYNELTIFTKTFASLLRNDVFITDSIEILSKLTKNEIYKSIMLKTVENIAKGEKISESFKNHWAVPDIAYYMIVTGENTGELANMMQKVSNYYQEQHAAIVNSLKSLIEPLLIIFLAVTVGGILIAVILPMFYLYNSIQL